MKRTVFAFVALAGSTVLLTGVGAFLMVANWPRPVEVPEWGFPGFQGLAGLVFAAVGSAVALRRSGNAVGWLLLTAGFLSAVQFVGHQYAIYGILTRPGAVPAAWAGTWIEEWIWLPILGCMGIGTFLLFPTGRLPSARWRVVVGLGVVGVVIGVAGTVVAPLVRVPGAVNPLADRVPPGLADGLTAAGQVGPGLASLALVLAAISLVIRFLAATGIERQQLKWLAFGALVIGFGMLAFLLAIVAGADPYGPAAAIFATSLFAAPLTIALAMLRHGLYEVDRLINRTVVYAVVSVVLGAFYTGSILVLQALLTPVTGGDTLAVAGSTLVVATIFQPIRRRVQTAVDQRFYRGRYDQARTVEAFGMVLRDEIDLAQLTLELRRVVSSTMQPSFAAVWIRRTRQ